MNGTHETGGNGTFGQNFPFAGFASVTRRNLRPQAIEQMFHFRPSLPLRHLVTGPERRRSTVRRGGVGGIRFARETADLLMLQGMMMRALHFYRPPVSTHGRGGNGHRLTVIQSMLPRRQPGIAREDAARDRRVIAVSPRQHGGRRAGIVPAAAGSGGNFRIGKGIRLPRGRLLRVVHLFHRIGADDRRRARGVGLPGFPRIRAQRRRLLQGCGRARTPYPRRARADPPLPLQAERDGALGRIGAVVRRHGAVDVQVREAGVHLAPQAAPAGLLRRKFVTVAVLRAVVILVQGR